MGYMVLAVVVALLVIMALLLPTVDYMAAAAVPLKPDLTVAMARRA